LYIDLGVSSEQVCVAQLKKIFYENMTKEDSMTQRYGFFAFVLWILFTSPIYSQTQKKWISAYYGLWSVPNMYPEKVDFSKATHIIHFSANPSKTAPYLDVLVSKQDSFNIQYGGTYNGNDINNPWYTSDIQKDLITRAHKAKAKVLLSVGGIYGQGAEDMSWIAGDREKMEIFVLASCAYAKRRGYDGIELDWEFPKINQRDDFSRLIRRFRRELDVWKPRGEFIIATLEYPDARYDKDALITACDQINPMTYGMYGGDFQNPRTGYNSPLEVSTLFKEYNGYAVNQPGHGPKQWIKKGYPAHKMGLSISFLAEKFHQVEPPVQPGQRYHGASYFYTQDIPQEGRHWDASSQVPWQASGSEMITYEDTMSVRLKIEYAQSLQLGGIMIYDLLGGYDGKAPEGKKEILLQTAYKCFLRNEP
jgi:GH18 family chitinase